MTEKPRRRFWQFSLSTAILLMFAVPVAGLIVLRANAWTPESKALTLQEFETRFPGWLDESAQKHIQSPDGTRVFSTNRMDNSILDAKNQRFEGRLFDFTIRDHDSDVKLALGLSTDATPIHYARGFIDDNNCVLIFTARDAEKTLYLRVWTRRYPEWWWGQLYRPEIWAGGVLGIVLIWKFVRYRRREVPSR